NSTSASSNSTCDARSFARRLRSHPSNSDGFIIIRNEYHAFSAPLETHQVASRTPFPMTHSASPASSSRAAWRPRKRTKRPLSISPSRNRNLLRSLSSEKNKCSALPQINPTREGFVRPQVSCSPPPPQTRHPDRPVLFREQPVTAQLPSPRPRHA